MGSDSADVRVGIKNPNPMHRHLTSPTPRHWLQQMSQQMAVEHTCMYEDKRNIAG